MLNGNIKNTLKIYVVKKLTRIRKNKYYRKNSFLTLVSTKS